MSQFWHSHWAEDAYKPGLLGNWQVPNWHPKWPCRRHCVTTTFLADRSGRLLPDKPKPKRSPWGDFKGTWDLPLKIDRKVAQQLSETPKYKLAAWAAHKAHYEGPCGFAPTSPKTTTMRTKAQPRRKSPTKRVVRTKKATASPRKIVDRKKETIGKDKEKTARETNAKQKTKSPPVKRAIDKTEKAREQDKLRTAVPKERSREPEEDEETVVEEAEYRGEKTVTKNPKHKEERAVAEKSQYEEERTVIKNPRHKEERSVVAEESQYEEERTVIEEPEYDKKKSDTKKSQYGDKNSVTKKSKYEDEKSVTKKSRYEDESSVTEKSKYEDERSVTEKSQYEDKKSVTKKPQYKEEKIVSNKPKHEQENTAFEKAPSQKPNREQHRKGQRIACYCVNESDSHPPEEIAPKVWRNVCAVHQTLRV